MQFDNMRPSAKEPDGKSRIYTAKEIRDLIACAMQNEQKAYLQSLMPHALTPDYAIVSYRVSLIRAIFKALDEKEKK